MLANDLTTVPIRGRDERAEGLKDFEQLSWLLELDPVARADWRKRLQWVRIVDQLAQERLLNNDEASLSQHFVVPRDPENLGVSWCEAWQRYVVAVGRYCQPKAVVPDLAAHQEMLLELGGNVFCLLPGVDWSLRRAIAHFGALDHYFDQLLDLNRDAHQGVCHFPLHVLASFRMAPQDIVDRSCLSKPEFLDMMALWLDRYLPTLREEAAEFSRCDGLPQGLQLMRAACLRRHERIERAFREAGFDFIDAERAYWSEVEECSSVRWARVG